MTSYKNINSAISFFFSYTNYVFYFRIFNLVQGSIRIHFLHPRQCNSLELTITLLKSFRENRDERGKNRNS